DLELHRTCWIAHKQGFPTGLKADDGQVGIVSNGPPDLGCRRELDAEVLELDRRGGKLFVAGGDGNKEALVPVGDGGVRAEHLEWPDVMLGHKGGLLGDTSLHARRQL